MRLQDGGVKEFQKLAAGLCTQTETEKHILELQTRVTWVFTVLCFSVADFGECLLSRFLPSDCIFRVVDLGVGDLK